MESDLESGGHAIIFSGRDSFNEEEAAIYAGALIRQFLKSIPDYVEAGLGEVQTVHGKEDFSSNRANESHRETHPLGHIRIVMLVDPALWHCPDRQKMIRPGGCWRC